MAEDMILSIKPCLGKIVSLDSFRALEIVSALGPSQGGSHDNDSLQKHCNKPDALGHKLLVTAHLLRSVQEVACQPFHGALQILHKCPGSRHRELLTAQYAQHTDALRRLQAVSFRV